MGSKEGKKRVEKKRWAIMYRSVNLKLQHQPLEKLFEVNLKKKGSKRRKQQAGIRCLVGFRCVKVKRYRGPMIHIYRDTQEQLGACRAKAILQIFSKD